MSIFEKREDAFENKFAKDQEAEFKVKAKRNKIIANWAAELLGFDKNGVHKYIDGILYLAIDDGASDEEIIDKIYNDFVKAEVKISKNDLEREFSLKYNQAKKELGL